MIRIVLLGRTGNHLFQYALGRLLAEKHGVPLVLDASWFNAAGWEEVSHFLTLPIKAQVVRRFSLASRALRNFVGKHRWQYLPCPFLKEPADNQAFAPHFLDAPPDCVLFGYFQTPRYFESIADRLRAEFIQLLSASEALASSQYALCHALKRPTSVAVHIRRGDYLQHPEFQVCGDAYYRRTMEQMRTRLPGARFFVFSTNPHGVAKDSLPRTSKSLIPRGWRESLTTWEPTIKTPLSTISGLRSEILHSAISI